MGTVLLPSSSDNLHALRSLATETDYVRGRLATYANDLISLGVTGLRLDASKREHLRSKGLIIVLILCGHCPDIPATDIANIVSRLSTSVYITQEVSPHNGTSVCYILTFIR